MPVYFVYRCHYGAPSEKHVRRFEHDSVLEWAQAVWKQFDNDTGAYEYAEELLGGLRVYSFGSMFLSEPDSPRLGPPETMADVHDWFQGMYDQDHAHGPHHVQVLTDDDELDMAVYVFDDHYREANPGKADFLLVDGWELPGGCSDGPVPELPETELVGPRGAGEGAVSAACLNPQSDNLRDKNECDRAMRIEGVRVPELARYLLMRSDQESYDLGLRELRDNLLALLKNPTGEDAGFLAAIRDRPDELTNWGAYSDWLQERDLPPAGLHLLERALRAEQYSDGRDSRNPAFDRVKVTPHMAQACKHEMRRLRKPMTDDITRDDTFAQFIFFDDRWAAAHPTLAAGILTFASRWDVLT